MTTDAAILLGFLLGVFATVIFFAYAVGKLEKK